MGHPVYMTSFVSKRCLKTNCNSNPLPLQASNLQKMPDEWENNQLLNALLPHICKNKSRIDDYFIIRSGEEEIGDENEEQSHFYVFHDPKIQIPEPKLDIWAYLDKEGVLSLLNCEKPQLVRRAVDSLLNPNHPKGSPRYIFIELIYTIVKFCKKLQFDVEKCSAVLSIFYLTHNYFISKSDVPAEKIYNYFKDLTMCHSIPFPPKCLRILSHADATAIMELFCNIYLRNLPLVRFLCSPNFAFQLQYELPVEQAPEKLKKEKKGKKGKGSKKGSGKGSKKSSKK